MGGVSKVFKKVVKVIVGAVKAVVSFVGDVVGFVLSPFGALDMPSVNNPEQEAQGVKVNKQGTNVAIPVIYGYRRVGGSIIFAETNGTSNKYLYIVYAICEGEIEGIKRILVNDVDLPLPTNKYAFNSTINVTEGRYKDRIQMQLFSGSEGQAQSSLANETPTWPIKQRKLPGVAYAVMRFEWKEIKTQDDANNNPFSGGIPKVEFDVLGKKVYDVRNHAGGATLSADYANLTKGYSFNPANCLLDYMLNPRYGAGFAKEEIDADSFKVAANKFEQTVNYSNSQSGRALTLNAVLDTRSKVIDNTKILLAGSRGIMPFVQGRYKLKVEDGGNPTDITSATVSVAYDVTKSNIIGGIKLNGETKTSKYNQVLVNYIDPDLNFSSQQVVFNRSGDQTADDEEVLTGEFTFNTLTNKAIAYDMAQMIYDKSRSQRQINFKGSQELMNVEIGDIIRVTDTILNFNQKTFRVVGLKLNADATVDMDAVEHDATLYPFTTGEQVETPPSLYLPDEFTIIPYVRPLPVNPIGVVPPNDPDEDSAGEGPNNELPPSWDRPINGINLFTNKSPYAYGYTLDNLWYGDQNAGLGMRAQTGGTPWYEISGPNYAFNGEPYYYLRLQLNQPEDRLVNFLREENWFNRKGTSTYYVQWTTEYNVRGNVNGASFSESRGFWGFYDAHVDIRASKFFRYKWVKRLNGEEFEFPDDSDLGQVYSYYDPIAGKTKNEKTITAFVNHVNQNISSFITPAANANSVITSHSLGA